VKHWYSRNTGKISRMGNDFKTPHEKAIQ
jgi:hypothetical protein